MSRKQASKRHNPSAEKQPRASIGNKFSIEAMGDHYPVWQLKILDMEHKKWGWKNLKNHKLNDVLSKLKNYETMAWKEIKANTKRDHSVSCDDLSPEARKRLKVLELDDIDELFRLRLAGPERVWGILEGYIFKILWWDSDHSVCLSHKK